MPLYRFRDKGRRVVRPLLRVMLKVHPDVVTWFSLLFALCAGFCFYKSQLRLFLLLGVSFIFLRMGCNLLDGMIAREKGTASPKGEALSEGIDRFADTSTLLGIIFSPLSNLSLGIFALALMLLSSYLGILGKAVGGRRIYGGVMGKVDRYIIISIFALFQFFCPVKIFGLTLFNLLLILLALGGVVTIFQRIFLIRKELK